MKTHRYNYQQIFISPHSILFAKKLLDIKTSLTCLLKERICSASFVYLHPLKPPMKIRYVATIIFIVSFSFISFSQNTNQAWSLKQCIDYALKNNIQIKQNLLNERIAELTLLQNKAQVLPNLNGNAYNSYNNGKKVDPFTNTFVSGDWTLSQNFSLTAGITLFGGFQTLNAIKQSRYDLLAGRQDVEKMQNDISLNIASAYLQILFARELLTVTQSQREITKLQVERTQKLVDAGSAPKGNLLDIQSQLASEDVNVVSAENNVSISTLNLVQMLNLDSANNFTIEKPEITIPPETILNTNAVQVYDIAVTQQPQIKSSELKLKSSEKGINIARASRYPKISLSASYGTGFSGASKQLSIPPIFQGYFPNGDVTASGDIIYSPTFGPPGFQTIPFNTQINNNLNRSVGLYVTVPLFNNLQTSTAVSRAKINRTNSELTLQLQKDNLKKTIQQAYNDATASIKKYQASQRAVSAMEESFKYMDQKYIVGVVTVTEYNDAKNKLIKATSDLLQAKYDYVFKLKVLDFYQGKPISL